MGVEEMTAYGCWIVNEVSILTIELNTYNIKIANIVEIDRKHNENLQRFLNVSIANSQSFFLVILVDYNPKISSAFIDGKLVDANLHFIKAKSKYESYNKILYTTYAKREFDLSMLLFFRKNFINIDITGLETSHLVIGNDWDRIEDLFEILNYQDHVKYVILRGTDELLLETSKIQDIDFLVDDWKWFSRIISLSPNKYKPYKGFIKIGGYKVSIDIRFLGDGYLDSNWQRNILDTRVFNSFFYIANKENYLFSVLYHKLLHKKGKSLKYVEEASVLQNKYNIKGTELINLLAAYIEKNNYNIPYCIDPSVQSNINKDYYNSVVFTLTPFVFKSFNQVIKESVSKLLPKKLISVVKKVIK